ncbi:unnamed protein product, partial [Scytosiphon promiscuus]
MESNRIQSVKKILFVISAIFLIVFFEGCNGQSPVELSSPDGSKTIRLFTNESQQINLSVWYGEKEIILPSNLEILSKDIDFNGPFS